MKLSIETQKRLVMYAQIYFATLIVMCVATAIYTIATESIKDWILAIEYVIPYYAIITVTYICIVMMREVSWLKPKHEYKDMKQILYAVFCVLALLFTIVQGPDGIGYSTKNVFFIAMLAIPFIASLVHPSYGIATTLTNAGVSMLMYHDGNYLNMLLLFGGIAAFGALIRFVFMMKWNKIMFKDTSSSNQTNSVTMLLIGILCITLVSSCSSLDRKVVIRDSNGSEYTAIIGLNMYNTLPQIGSQIPIYRPQGWRQCIDNNYFYNDPGMEMSDTTVSFSGVKREIIFGEVVAVH